jgi:diaminopimelate epimerase
MSLPFRKYQALQNDYLLFDAQDAPLSFSPEVIAAMCHRRTGAGADGILIVSRAPGGGDARTGGAFRMDILNSDGSTAAMCGNGLRCVGKFLVDSGHLAVGARAEVLTASGWRHVTVLGHAPAVSRVVAGLGLPRVLDPALRAGDLSFVHVDVGNPHMVHFLDVAPLAPGLHRERQKALELGPALEHALAGGVNVGFAVITGPSTLDLAVWERGAGFTQACGTGATAAVTAARHLGLVGDGPVLVGQAGGDATVTLDADGSATLEGPAHFVFAGQWPSA